MYILQENLKKIYTMHLGVLIDVNVSVRLTKTALIIISSVYLNGIVSLLKSLLLALLILYSTL
ncbi:MAG: hypothetical protein BGO44_02295 [Legionella sp. 39-23]|nr:MAG: hypothetical protein BGO44_02295 [Legionella sp. 39-23]